MPAFSLPDTVSGRSLGPDDFPDAAAYVVAFICNHCPYVKHIRAGLAVAGRAIQERGGVLFAISANDAANYPEDSPEAMTAEAKAAGFAFPYLHDESQETAKAFGAVCTPEFFVYDKHRRLVYRGQMDSSRPGNAEPVTAADLLEAVNAAVAGEGYNGERKPALGCSIKWKPGNGPA